jgi:hypothetical protein
MEGINIDTLHPSPGDIIIISIDINKFDLEEASEIVKGIRDTVSDDITIIGVPAGAIKDIISIKKEAIETIDEVRLL